MGTEELIPDVFKIKFDWFPDERGSFSPIFNKEQFKKYTGIKFEPLQLNSSNSKKNVVRGLHYQLPPLCQSKLVTVSSGAIIDIVIDIRKKSKSFGRMLFIPLSDTNNEALFIPKGFAHGFVSLQDNTVVNYLVDEEFVPHHQQAINPYSIQQLISLKQLPEYNDVIISAKDLHGIDFSNFKGI